MRRRASESLTAYERQKIRDLYAEGVPVSALAIRFRISAVACRLLCNVKRLCVDCGEPLNCLNERRKRHANCKPVLCDCGNPVMGKHTTVCLMCRALAATASGELKATARAVRHANAPKHVSQSVFLRHDPIQSAYRWAVAVQR